MTITKPSVTFELKLIYPADAKMMLAMNTRNRTIRRLHAQAIGRDLTRGNFRFNGQTISFTKSGLLVDGQHRLTACVESGVPFWSIVVYGLDDDIYTFLDTNSIKRQAHDALEHYGIESPKTVAAICRLVTWYRGNKRWIARDGNREYRLTNDDIVQIVAEDEAKYIEAARFGCRCRVKREVSAGLIGAWYYCAAEVDRGDATRFFSSLNRATQIEVIQPAGVLSERLKNASKDKEKKLRMEVIFSMGVLAWNAFRDGRKIHQFRVPKNGRLPKFK